MFPPSEIHSLKWEEPEQPRMSVNFMGLVGQLVPLYTDWLWFDEVGYTSVFLKTLSLRGSLFTTVAVGVFLFLYLNLTFAARTAPPDVLWELEDQLGLPGATLPALQAAAVDRAGWWRSFASFGATPAQSRVAHVVHRTYFLMWRAMPILRRVIRCWSTGSRR